MNANRKSCLPKSSLLNTYPDSIDYADSFSSEFILPGKIEAVELGRAFFSGSPKWVGKLFNFRNRLVKLIGLKTPENLKDRQKQLDHFQCLPGERVGLFKVFEKTDSEVILGEDDKHLDFRVSLLLRELTADTKNLTITTIVHYNNCFGRLYFLPVRLFHRQIVPAMLESCIQKLKAGNN